MTLDSVVQGWVFTTMALAIALLARTDKYARWGFPAMLAAQPGYFYATVVAEQTGMFFLTVWFTAYSLVGTYKRFGRNA